jgi:hypothetical protein
MADARDRGGIGSDEVLRFADVASLAERNAGIPNGRDSLAAGSAFAAGASGSSVKVLRIEARISSIDASGELILVPSSKSGVAAATP